MARLYSLKSKICWRQTRIYLFTLLHTVQNLIEEQQRSLIRFPNLPLAVYREVAAHLRQVDGVNAGLLPQESRQFDYNESQIGALWIEFSPETDQASRERVEQILAYYSNRYSPWEEVDSLKSDRS